MSDQFDGAAQEAKDAERLDVHSYNEFLGAIQGGLIERGLNPPCWPQTILGLGDLEGALDSATDWCADLLVKLARYEAASGELPPPPFVYSYKVDLHGNTHRLVSESDYNQLRAAAAALKAENRTLRNAAVVATERAEELERMANMRHESIAKGVFETVKDAAATWDTASDELIWQDPAIDPAVQKHWKVSKEHLETCCVRFPQWADDLRSFAERWNEDEPLSNDDLAAVEVTDEVVERGTQRALQIMRFYMKLRKVEAAEQEARVRIAELMCELDQSHALVKDERYCHGQTIQQLKRAASEEIKAANDRAEAAVIALAAVCGYLWRM